MNIFITGGSGFIGTALSNYLLDQSQRVTATGSSLSHPTISHDHFTFISADTTHPGNWQESVKESEIVINLAGRTIFKPWTKRYKQSLYSSRVMTTQNLVAAMQDGKANLLCSISAAGIFGDRGDEILTEESTPGDDFLARICIDWEKEALRLKEKNIRVAVLRLGVVMGKNGGALEKMLPAYKFFMGGPLGNGKQWFPWIHMQDIISAIQYIMNSDQIQGPINLCSPGSVRQAEFAEILASTLNRPHFARVPALVLKVIMGELGKALLSSQRVVPQHLLDHQFRFKFDTLEKALEDLIHQ